MTHKEATALETTFHKKGQIHTPKRKPKGEQLTEILREGEKNTVPKCLFWERLPVLPKWTQRNPRDLV